MSYPFLKAIFGLSHQKSKAKILHFVHSYCCACLLLFLSWDKIPLLSSPHICGYNQHQPKTSTSTYNQHQPTVSIYCRTKKGNHWSIMPPTPNSHSQSKRILWSTVSRASGRSKSSCGCTAPILQGHQQVGPTMSLYCTLPEARLKWVQAIHLFQDPL